LGEELWRLYYGSSLGRASGEINVAPAPATGVARSQADFQQRLPHASTEGGRPGAIALSVFQVPTFELRALNLGCTILMTARAINCRKNREAADSHHSFLTCSMSLVQPACDGAQTDVQCVASGAGLAAFAGHADSSAIAIARARSARF